VKIRVPISEHRDASYDIRIGRGLLAELPELVRAACPAARYAVITDSHIGKLYGEQVVTRLHDATLPAELFEFPAGEWNKTRETWAALSDRMLARQFGRDCAVLALGGVAASISCRYRPRYWRRSIRLSAARPESIRRRARICWARFTSRAS